MALEREFYQGKRVLVTGHTGFKGTWLCWILKTLGAEVCGYSLPPAPGSLFEKASAPIERSYFDDIRNWEHLNRVITDFQPEVVFHLAAHSVLDGSYEKPAYIFDVNIMGTVRLLEALRFSKRKTTVIIVTSDKCYSQKLNGKPCLENDPFGAAEAYSTSKACQDLVAQSYQFSFPNLAVATARASNTIGGGDGNNNRLVPYLLDCFIHDKPAVLRNPGYVRPWQSVLDVLCGYLLLAQKIDEQEICCQPFNFGPTSDGFASVKTVTECLAKQFPGARYHFSETSKNSETELLRLDSHRATELLQWKRIYSLETIMKKTAEFAKRIQTENIRKVCGDQVAEYLALLSKMENRNE